MFADARQRFEPDAIAQLVANFSDPSVGCVSGELMFQVDTESSVKLEMGAYWKYEKWIRKMESQTGSVVGATGAIYAMWRKLYTPLPAAALLDDVLSPMNVVVQGYRVVFESKAIAYDILSDDVVQE
jgi:biofilm PGA synthesis N-glycosyltransferase PgaC